ncbi:kinesin light chain 3 [Amylocarpus encephaloides]|uniref:Kinesin light chain 3 n=1 Tax=Amylocarpus encephaloides TaxID=45428 RepID=A0A9P7YNQ7_9HELO|nr:kinesin light chain 3 [Amylocarpus encephaloides]
MRLLKLVGPGEFSLVQVPTHNLFHYAILSHTWIDGQEITYQELINGTGKNKSGYDKLKFCGEQAAKDRLLYFWVDTCCIDKSDRDEHSKAINSMFRWYRNAKKCYVYLADVSDTQTTSSRWEAAFRGSRWFTRGWTLQELLAPEVVEFYSKEGKLLGDRSSLEKPIHEITGIPIQALRGNSFSDFSIDERKGWVVRRQTTEEEDIVYCLLGLCEVSMPPIYGEGEEVALKRLEMTIKGFSKDSSELKDQKENNPHFIVPFDRNPNFIGRESQLAKIEEHLSGQGQTTKLAITGLGGVGKTQLALELVYRLGAKRNNYSIIWIPATNLASLQQAYIGVAQQLCIPGSEEDNADVKRLVQDYLSKERTGQWLLVFDNADDIDMWIAKSPERESRRLIDYLPRSKHGCIVFTTRDRKTAVKLAQKNVVEVPELDEDMATCMLQKRLINPDLLNNRPDTKALLQELTYLPLAITQAAAYINENGIAFSDYLLLLADQEEEVIDLLSEDFEDEGRYENVKNPVVTTWIISFEQIRQNDPLAADYLFFMACIDSKDIPRSLLPAGQSRKRETNAIGTLDAYSFIIKRPADLALDLHRLVHLATRNWLRKQNLIAEWTRRAITRLEEVFPDDDDQNRSIWRTYLPHVRYALTFDTINKDEENRMKLAWRFGTCLFSDGRYNEAEGQFIEALEIEMRALGPEHPDTLTSMASLASTYRNQGRWKEAEDLEVQVMETSSRVLGLEHPDTLTSMANLASTFWNQGRWKEAEDLEVQVMDTRKRVSGLEHPSTLTGMANLASTYRNQGRWKEAEDLGVQVMETRKRVSGLEHPSTLTSMTNLASTFWNQGRWKEAEDLEVQVMETSSRALGPEHPDTQTSMANLASTFWNQGRWKEAEDLEVQVMETRKRVLGLEHPETLISMANLASTYRNQGRWKEAEDLGVQVMETSSRVLGLEHSDTLTSMASLASTYRNQGRWKEAEDLGVQVMETSSRVLGLEHPDTLTSMANLASTYRNQGRWKEAEDLEVQVMETRKRVLGLEHPDTLTSMANLASTFWNQGRWKEAEDLEVQVIEARKRVLGLEHPDTLTSIANLASTYRNQGRWKEAEDLDVQLMETRKRLLGLEHPDTLTSMANLALTYRNQGRWKEAEDLGVQVIETRKRVLGLEHPDMLTSIANLASTYRNQGRWKEAEDLGVQVMETSSRVLGLEHPDTLTSMANLASTFWNQGRWKEAEDLGVQVMETSSRVLGLEHPDTLTSIANLASTYRNQGRWKEAEDLDVQVMETSSRVLGLEHPDTLTSMANLASTFWNQGRWKEAEDLDVQVIETRKRVLGLEHPDTLSSMNNLAYTWRAQGRLKEALSLMEECFRCRVNHIGMDHPDTQSSLKTRDRWREEDASEQQVEWDDSGTISS